jgi:acetyltransferase
MATRADDRRWRREIVVNARASGVRILGPASFGVIRTSQGLNATLGAATALPGRLTLLSQSGAIVGALLDFARSAGIGFASVAALGAGSDVDVSELLEFALTDVETEGIVLYIETVPAVSCRARAACQLIIVLKSVPAPGNAVARPGIRRGAQARRNRAWRGAAFHGAARISPWDVSRGNRLAIVTSGRGPVAGVDRAAEVSVACELQPTRWRARGLPPVPNRPIARPHASPGLRRGMRALLRRYPASSPPWFCM